MIFIENPQTNQQTRRTGDQLLQTYRHYPLADDHMHTHTHTHTQHTYAHTHTHMQAHTSSFSL